MPYPYDLRGEAKRLSDEQLKELSVKEGVAPWTLVCGTYGSSLEVFFRRRVVKKALKRFGRVQLFSETAQSLLCRLVLRIDSYDPKSIMRKILTQTLEKFSGHSLKVIRGLTGCFGYQKGIPGKYLVSTAVYYKNRKGKPEDRLTPIKDGCGLLWLAIAFPSTTQHIDLLRQMCKDKFDDYQVEFIAALVSLNPRTMILAMPIYYDKTDKEEVGRVKALYDEVISSSRKMGYLQYRTSVLGMKTVLENSPVFSNLCREIKMSLDPNAVFAPGKYGIETRDKTQDEMTNCHEK